MNTIVRATHSFRQAIGFAMIAILSLPAYGQAQSTESVGGRLRDSTVMNPDNEWVPDFNVPVSAKMPAQLNVPITQFAQALSALEAGRLTADDQAGAIDLLKGIAADDPERSAADAKLAELADRFDTGISAALAQRDLVLAANNMNLLEAVSPGDARIARRSEELAGVEKIIGLWVQADELLAAGSYVEPESTNALSTVREILALDPSDEKAQSALEQIESALIAQAETAVSNQELLEAKELLAFATEIRGGSDSLVGLTATVEEKITEFHQSEVTAVQAALRAEQLDQAELHLANLENWGYEHVNLNPLKMSLARARISQQFPPGLNFSDNAGAGAGPTMVVVPQGTFVMGSPQDEVFRSDAEGPQRGVAFDMQFALSTTEITVGQFELFVAGTGYLTDAEQSGETMYYNTRTGKLQKSSKFNWRHDFSGRRADSELPVVHVSWNDAKQYARWLSEESGQEYRLPSEAEFEYALRSGSEALYWWGETSPDRKLDNLTGGVDSYKNKWEWPDAFEKYGDDHWGPAPAATYESNSFGLHDMGGNVMEWTEDCWTDSLSALPDRGRPNVDSDCKSRTVRGGSWASPPNRARSAYRVSSKAERASCLVGFRVARVLAPRESPQLAKF